MDELSIVASLSFRRDEATAGLPNPASVFEALDARNACQSESESVRPGGQDADDHA